MLPTLELPGLSAPDPNLDIQEMVTAWARCWARWLRQHPSFPKLYSTTVRYVPEPSSERWQGPPTTLRKAAGDCEDLTVWRLAELLAANVQCAPKVVGRQLKLGGLTQHVFVGFPDGRTEDPSVILLERYHGKG